MHVANPQMNKAQASHAATGPKANAKTKTDSKKTPADKKNTTEANRQEGKTLAGAVGEGIKNTTSAVATAGVDVVKESAKSSITSVVKNAVYPLRMQLSIPPLSFLVGPISNFITGKLDKYIQDNNIQIGMQPSAIVHELLFGDIEKLSTEATDLLGSFWKKSIPDKLKAAIESKSPIKILMASGGGVTSVVRAVFNQMFSESKNKFTSPFIFLGKKIPFVNKLSPKFQPWAAGVGTFLFGGMAVRLVIKAVKYLVGLTVLGTGGVFVKKMYDKLTKQKPGTPPPDSSAPAAKPSIAGTAMNALTKMAGVGPGGAPSNPATAVGAAGGGGLGGLMNTASSVMNMFGGGKK